MSATAPIKMSKVQLKILAKNLGLLLRERNLSENDIAQAINIPVMTVRRIVSGETADPRISTLALFADYFKVSVDSLMANNEMRPISLIGKNIAQFIPILDWQTASKIASIKDIHLKTWRYWHPIPLSDQYLFSEDAFALESRPSMQPRFPLGTLFIIEPNEEPADTDILLVRMKKDNSLSLRQVIIDSPKWQLQPVVHGSEVIFYNRAEHVITGVVVLTMLYSRKDKE